MVTIDFSFITVQQVRRGAASAQLSARAASALASWRGRCQNSRRLDHASVVIVKPLTIDPSSTFVHFEYMASGVMKSTSDEDRGSCHQLQHIVITVTTLPHYRYILDISQHTIYAISRAAVMTPSVDMNYGNGAAGRGIRLAQHVSSLIYSK